MFARKNSPRQSGATLAGARPFGAAPQVTRRVTKESRVTSWHLLTALALVLSLLATLTPLASAQTPSTDSQGVGYPVAGPVIWTTDEMLDRVAQRVAAQEEPFYTAWVNTLARADEALGMQFKPYNGFGFNFFFRTARDHAKYVRDLGIVYRVTGDQRYADKAKEILMDWARDVNEYDYPEDRARGYAPYPASQLPHASGLVIGRVISIFADGYAIVWDEFSDDENAQIHQWFQAMVPPIKESQRIWKEGEYTPPNGGAYFPPPYLDRQFYNNHLAAHNLGLAAIAYATNDPQLRRYALKSPNNPRDLVELIEGLILMPGDMGYYKDPSYTDPENFPPPLTCEVWDRYRINGDRGMVYALSAMRFLTLTVEMTANNPGRDYYGFEGDKGETIECSYEVYSPWWIERDAAAVNPPYFADEQIYPGFDRIVDEVNMWELVNRQYPDNAQIEAALEAAGARDERVVFDAETFGWTAILTHGRQLGD